MTEIAVVKLSSHGQITLPTAAREALDLREGDSLIVVVQGDKIILRKLVLDDLPGKSPHD